MNIRARGERNSPTAKSGFVRSGELAENRRRRKELHKELERVNQKIQTLRSRRSRTGEALSAARADLMTSQESLSVIDNQILEKNLQQTKLEEERVAAKTRWDNARSEEEFNARKADYGRIHRKLEKVSERLSFLSWAKTRSTEDVTRDQDKVDYFIWAMETLDSDIALWEQDAQKIREEISDLENLDWASKTWENA